MNLEKLGWQFYQEDNRLWVKVLERTYGDSRRMESFSVSSHTWQSLVEGYRLLRASLEWQIGNRRRCRFWLDPWLGEQRLVEITLTPVPKKEK